MLTRNRFVAFAASTALVLAACGDDDSGGGSDLSDDEREYADALAQNILDDDGDGDGDDFFRPDEQQAECMASRWISTIGTDRLSDAGITPENLGDDDDFEFSDIGLTEDEANELYDAMEACGLNIREAFLAGMTEDSDLDDDAAECLEEEISDDFLRRLMVTMLLEGDDSLDGDEELLGELFAIFAQCPGAIDFG